MGNMINLDIQCGKVVEVEEVEGSNFLFKEQVCFGNEEKIQIVSGIRGMISKEDFLGKNFLFLRNIKPIKLMGNASQGMILVAKSNSGSEEELVKLLPEISPGDSLCFEGKKEPITKLKGSKITSEMAKLKINLAGF